MKIPLYLDLNIFSNSNSDILIFPILPLRVHGVSIILSLVNPEILVTTCGIFFIGTSNDANANTLALKDFVAFG
jgi:hypothetical protein